MKYKLILVYSNMVLAKTEIEVEGQLINDNLKCRAIEIKEVK